MRRPLPPIVGLRSWLVRGVLACGLLASIGTPTPVAAAVIATDADVPATMNVIGTSGDYAQYVIGNTAGFTRTFLHPHVY